VPEWFSR